MARKARQTLQSKLVLVTQKSNQRMYRDDHDRDVFLDLLKKVQSNFDCVVLAFCCFDEDAFQIVIDTNGANISKIIQSLTISYALHRKSEHKLFTQRFKTQALMDESEVRTTIERLREGKDDYVGCCMFSETLQRYDWIKPYPNVRFLNLRKEVENIEPISFEVKLEAYLNEHKLSLEELLKQKDKRNDCIKYFRKEMDCSLAKLGEVFRISESSVSKIINSDKQST